MKIIIAKKTVSSINLEVNGVKKEMVAAKLIRKTDSAAKQVSQTVLAVRINEMCDHVNTFQHFSMEDNGQDLTLEIKDELMIKIVGAVASIVVPYARFMKSAQEIAIKHLKPIQKLISKKYKKPAKTLKVPKQPAGTPISRTLDSTRRKVAGSRETMADRLSKISS
jgi:hypothetical protein